MLVTGEHRRERSAEGQWCGADLPGLQMITMVITMVMMTTLMMTMMMIAMMIDEGLWEGADLHMHIAYTCVYASYVLYFVSSFLPEISMLYNIHYQ